MQLFLLHDGANRSLTEKRRLEGATLPQAENTALQKCEANFRSNAAYSVSVGLPAFSSDLGCELFHNGRCWWPSTARASKNQCVEAAVFIFADLLLVDSFLTLSWYLYASFMVLGQLFAWGLKTFTSKKMRLKREPHRSFALMSTRASSSVVVEILDKKSSSSDWSFRSIWTSWQTSSIGFAKTSPITLFRRCVYPPLAQCRAWVRLNSVPHGHMADVFFASQV